MGGNPQAYLFRIMLNGAKGLLFGSLTVRSRPFASLRLTKWARAITKWRHDKTNRQDGSMLLAAVTEVKQHLQQVNVIYDAVVI